MEVTKLRPTMYELQDATLKNFEQNVHYCACARGAASHWASGYSVSELKVRELQAF